MSILIDFNGRVRISALSVLGVLMLIEVRAAIVVGVGRSLALRGPVTEGRVYTFVEQFRSGASCATLSLEVFHEPVKAVRTRGAVGRDPR